MGIPKPPDITTAAEAPPDTVHTLARWAYKDM
jgi:hypothetical protein